MCSITCQRQLCFLQCLNLISPCLCIEESKKQNSIQSQAKGKQKKQWSKNGMICIFLFGILLACLSNIPQLHQHPTRRHWRHLTPTHPSRRGCTRRWFQKKHAMTTTSVGDHRVIWVIWVIDAEVIKSDKVEKLGRHTCSTCPYTTLCSTNWLFATSVGKGKAILASVIRSPRSYSTACFVYIYRKRKRSNSPVTSKLPFEVFKVSFHSLDPGISCKVFLPCLQPSVAHRTETRENHSLRWQVTAASSNVGNKWKPIWKYIKDNKLLFIKL